MAGNVSEWCFDWYSQYPSISVVDPIGPENGTSKMYRGGNYNVYAKDCRRHFRYCMVYGNRYSYIGLRLAL
jgi:formylglycine-generating enzyme required for sulfatase activity